MADTVIENLITKLSFDFDEKKLKKFDDAIATAEKGLLIIIGAAGAAAISIFSFTKSIAISNDELGKFSEKIGVDLTALQELGYVAELNGGSIDSMNSSLGNLSRMASEAARGVGAGVEAFGILGISVTDAEGQIKTADDLLYDVSDAIKKLGTQAEKLELTQKLGIGEDLLLSIQSGSEAIRQQRKEAQELGFTINKDATKSAADFNDELLRITKIITGLINVIGIKLMKQITPVIKLFVNWFKANKAIIQQDIITFFDKTVIIIRGVFNVVSRVVGVVLSLVSAMGGWKNSILAVTGLLLTMNASALLMPILVIAAGAGILLVLEDIIKFAENGDSVIGKLAEKFPILDAALRTMLDLLKLIPAGWSLIFSSGTEAFEGLMMMIKDIGISIKTYIFDNINKAIKLINKTIGYMNKIPGVNIGMIGGLGNKENNIINNKENNTINNKENNIINNTLPAVVTKFITEAPINREKENINDIVPQEKNIINNILPTVISESIMKTQATRKKGNTGNILSQKNNSTINNTNNNPNITISINGGDTDKVKQVVSEILSQQYSGAQTNLSSQVEF